MISDALKNNVPALTLMAVGVFLQIMLSVISSLFGDRIYRDYVIENIKKIKKESDDADYDYHKKGGANFFLLLAGFLAVQYLPQLIAPFFK